MKKVRFLLLTASILVALLALFSCGAPSQAKINSAEDLFEAIDTEMSSLGSYKVDGEVDMTVYAQGVKMGISGSVTEIISDLSGNECYVYSKSNLSYVINNRDVTFYEELTAYHGGNAFVSSTVNSTMGEQKRALYSPLSREVFLEYYEYLSTVSIDDADIYDCQNPTYTQSENGSWDILLTGYSEEFIKDYIGGMGFFDEIFDDKITDMTIGIKTNSKFRVTMMTLDLIFEDDGDASTAPKVNVETYFSQHNDAELITDELNVENYNEVVDVRLVDGIQYMMDAIKDSEKNELELEITSKIGTGTYIENDTVSYGVDGGKYYYDIHYPTDAITYDISYRDGEVTTTSTYNYSSDPQNTSTVTSKQTELEAKNFINGLINSVKYDKTYVNDIEKCEDGRYKVSLLPTDVDTYKTLVSSQLKGSYKGATHVIYFTVENGRILKMESEIIIEYSYWNGFSSATGEVILTAVVDLT